MVKRYRARETPLFDVGKKKVTPLVEGNVVETVTLFKKNRKASIFTSRKRTRTF